MSLVVSLVVVGVVVVGAAVGVTVLLRRSKHWYRTGEAPVEQAWKHIHPPEGGAGG